MALFDTLMSISNTASSAKNTYAAAKTIASNSQPLPEEDREKNADIAYIKEHGFTTYVKELEERKIEEMRRKILQSMGLDEESLAKMDTAARQAIEKSISEAIEQKLNGATLANKQNDGNETPAEQRDRMQAEIAFNPRMFDVFTALQSELSDGSVQSITPDEKKNQDSAT
ncbi:hypothetical protein [Thalassospira australica]|uniref:hypothetical protein n=1 Tax=Thalassospira australica TaxID=1528106 RepID=UPI00385179A4